MSSTNNFAPRAKASLRLAAATVHQLAYELFGERVMSGDKSPERKKPNGRCKAPSLTRLVDRLPGGSLG